MHSTYNSIIIDVQLNPIKIKSLNIHICLLPTSSKKLSQQIVSLDSEKWYYSATRLESVQSLLNWGSMKHEKS